MPAESGAAEAASSNKTAPTPDGAFCVVTERTCGGFAESGALECGPLKFELLPLDQSPANQSPATVWATSLDGAPIVSSKRLLVAHVTDAANSGAIFDGPEARSWMEQGSTPALVRRGRAALTLTLANPVNGVNSVNPANGVTPVNGVNPVNPISPTIPPSLPRVFRLSPAGHRVAEIPAAFDAASGRLSFIADTGYDLASATFFYEIVR
jgi:hypothetical protein